jgi:V/A-type H+-transporting ATPase subunit F
MPNLSENKRGATPRSPLLGNPKNREFEGQSPSNIAVIGERDVILPFRALGVEIVPTVPGPEVREQVEVLLTQKKTVIFFTPDLFPYINPIMERTRKQAIPCFIALPLTKEELSIKRLKKLVARAVGAELI